MNIGKYRFFMEIFLKYKQDTIILLSIIYKNNEVQ
jgi:hypothetical protein